MLLLNRRRRRATGPAPGSDFAAATADDAAALMEAWPVSDAGSPYTGTLTLTRSGMVVRYETHVFAASTEVGATWFTARELDAHNDGVQTYLIPKGDWSTAGALDATFGRRSGVVIGGRNAALTHAGALRVTGSNLNVEGNGTSTLDPVDDLAYATALRGKAWPLARGTHGGVTDPEVPASGGAGGAGLTSESTTLIESGAAGTAGTNGATGGGGAGAHLVGTNATGSKSGSGAGGHAFGGGAGGGAIDAAAGVFIAEDGEDFGGKGGDGIVRTADAVRGASGGAGNPGGAAHNASSGTAVDGEDGVGGAFLIRASALSGAGGFHVDGFDGGGSGRSGGGASGAGSATAIVGDSSGWTGDITASGGTGGDGSSADGGDAGDGTAQILERGAA